MLVDYFFENIIKKDINISFFSMNSDFFSIINDPKISSHPHNDKFAVEQEFKSLFRFYQPVFINTGSLSARPQTSDIFIGFLYSNSVDVERTLKDNR
jgi:hypothetical protein